LTNELVHLVVGSGRFALVAIMAVAAAAKLFRLHDFRETLAAIEVLPTKLIGSLAVAMPVAEGASAVLLVIRPREGTIVACVLLLSFAVVAEIMHRRGRAVACSCFGQLSSSTLGRKTVERNIVFTGLGVVVAAVPPPWDANALPTALLGATAVATLAVVAQAFADVVRSPADTLALIEAQEAASR
jgi:Methylamine utilisation protein MauE